MIGGASPAHVDIAAVTSPAGDYEFGGLVPGDYEIVANVGGRLHTGQVRVVGGQTAELHFVDRDR
jgi:hypothetical protein